MGTGFVGRLPLRVSFDQFGVASGMSVMAQQTDIGKRTSEPPAFMRTRPIDQDPIQTNGIKARIYSTRLTASGLPYLGLGATVRPEAP